MIIKKNSNFSDEKNSISTFALCGFIFALSLILCVFEHKSIQYFDSGLKTTTLLVDDEPVYEIEREIILPPKPLTQPPKPPEFSKVVPEVPQKQAPELKKEIEPKTENDTDIMISELFSEPEPIIEEIFEVVEEDPEFIGGMAKLYEYLYKNVQYPEIARENGIQGKVFVKFLVWKDGTIRDVKVVKSVHKALDNEAIRLVKTMPKWAPGKQRGKPVKCYRTIPIKFKCI